MDSLPGGNSRFNAEAAAWDSNPFVHLMSAKAWEALRNNIDVLQQNADRLHVLEIGCGTGLLTFMVAPYVREVVAVDAAQGMIDALEAKIRSSHLNNIVPLAILLEDPEDPALPGTDLGVEPSSRRKFDLILSHLVLHHIPDLRQLLQTMLGCLKPGGMIALTDFEDFGPEAKRFHPESKMDGVERHGINTKWFQNLMKEVGFTDADVKVAWEHEKKVERWPGELTPGEAIGEDQGEKMNFTYLLCTGRKPADSRVKTS